jgi:hemerythrin superfamily protein
MTATTPAGAAGRRDVVDVLVADHRQITGLVRQVRQAADAAQQRELADTLIAEIVRHSYAEEKHVYPVMTRALPDGEEAVRHDTEEHEELERSLKQLEGLDPTDAAFLSVVDDIDRLLADHVDDEENTQFPQLRRTVDSDELVSLGGTVEEAMKAAPTRPHPNAPNHSLFHKVAGPGTGLVDRLRDRIAGRVT